ncbi:MAG: DNA repair protein RecO [Bacteroidales bacterium]|nr:DNA repair protein RecO [Bacteroidales bacterium]
MLIKTRAVVMHHVKYGESSIILYCYTEQYGRMACIVNHVRTKSSKFPRHLLQPLTILDMLVYYHPNRSLHRLKDLSSPVNYTSIPYQTSKSCIAMFMAELLYKTLHEEESNPALFDFLIKMLQVLDLNKEGMANFHLIFLLHYSRFLGFFPAGLLNNRNMVDSSDLQVFFTLPPAAVQSIKQMLQWPEVQPEEIKLNNKTRTMLLDRLIQYYSNHMQEILKMKSLPILKEVLK